ncbi:MAG: hypothetical protein IK091_03320 [Spirochaetales bacterium]|nr:hypothetical protein [Spirochaetales bacterium]MBR5098237.1 hypothetical protein [Spirochaetales bacterium]
MKKILFGLLVIAMVLALTACSQDQYEQLGELMGNMSGNIYGIEANLMDVENATNQVDGAVAVDGEGNVTVSLEAKTAQSIVSSVVSVKNSETKKEALKTSLSEPLLGKGATDASKAELKAQITAQATVSKIDTATVAEEKKELAESVNEVLDAVQASLSDNPTKAELATVAVLATLSDAVKNGNEETYKEAGKAAVDALKITTEIGQVDLFANIDLTKLAEMFTKGISRDIARDGEEEQDMLDKFMPVFGDSIPEVLDCLTENEKFTAQRYAKFVMECKAMRASYEMIAKGYNIDVNAQLRGQVAVDSGLTIEDLGHYMIAVMFSAFDSYDEDDAMVPFLELFINGNEELPSNYALIKEFDRDKLPDVTEEDSPYYEKAQAAADSMGANMVDEYNPEEDFSEFFINAVKDSSTIIGKKVNGVLQTIGVILIDSEYEGLLDQVELEETDSAAKGTLMSFLYFL